MAGDVALLGGDTQREAPVLGGRPEHQEHLACPGRCPVGRWTHSPGAYGEGWSWKQTFWSQRANDNSSFRVNQTL